LITAGSGRADENRAARMILKDYVTGKLLFNHPPPSVLAEYTEAFELQGVEEVLEKRAKAKADGVAHLSAAIQADMEAYEAAGYVSVVCICVFLSFLLFSLSSFLLGAYLCSYPAPYLEFLLP
jgi:hypothetical protein